ncbi:MAG: tetratricopeptide repeat protein, partial [Gaiellaceae bacterium]
ALQPGSGRTGVVALVASFVAYLVGAGVDWMWEMTVVSVVGIACLGLLTGPATTPAGISARQPGPPPRFRRAALLTGLLGAWLLICAQAIPLLAEVKIEDSRAAVRSGDFEGAAADAAAARSIQPWAASPYLQLALVEEEAGDVESARRWIDEALERDSADWRLWLVDVRLETKAGRIAEARESLDRVRALNPRSPLLAEGSSG